MAASDVRDRASRINNHTTNDREDSNTVPATSKQALPVRGQPTATRFAARCERDAHKRRKPEHMPRRTIVSAYEFTNWLSAFNQPREVSWHFR